MPANPAQPTPTKIPFTVDAALLRELGERLVGRPEIALAELVKNAYDADATVVTIRFETDAIEISDNGHGMTGEEFINRWMRIGSPKKAAERFSRSLGRRLTGSKGIGRLAVQFLGSELELRTAADPTGPELVAEVDWATAVQADQLTEAQVDLTTRAQPTGDFAGDGNTGVTIRIKRLTNKWTVHEVQSLAREVWWLQPPFFSGAAKTDFRVNLIAPDGSVETAFDTQMRRVLDLWEARLHGVLTNGREPAPAGEGREVVLFLEYRSGDSESVFYDVPGAEPLAIDKLKFEIRVFKLENRQPYGITVREAREYFNEFGGIRIYDAGFNLPYYGSVEQDWLGVERDHAHRLSASKLLPDGLNVAEGLNFLPTNSRLFGVVDISTNHEREVAEARARSFAEQVPFLEIQATRDRLADNLAFRQLRDTVRWALDYYATREKLRSLRQKDVASPAPSRDHDPSARLESVIQQLEAPVRETVRAAVTNVVVDVRREADATHRQIALLGPLATAGMLAMAFQHELGKRFSTLEVIASRLETAASDERDVLARAATDIRAWVQRSRETQSLFSLLEPAPDTRTTTRLRARPLLEELVRNIAPLLRGIGTDVTAVDPELRLPSGAAAQWLSIFQNVIVNAANAVLGSDERRIRIESAADERRRYLRILDTGAGVDLADAPRLFRPFERGREISAERRAMGYGGSGLGLPIVQLMATDLNATVEFVAPPPGFNTCFQISWTEMSA